MATTYGPYKPTINNKPVQGPGLGWNNDIIKNNSQGGYAGLVNTQGQTLGATTGGGGGGQPQVNQSQPVQTPQGPSQEDFYRQIDEIYNPQYDYLNQVESTLRGDQGTSIKEAEGQYGVNKQLLDNSKSQALTQTQNQLQQGERRKEDALSAARRLYNELQQANRARFGALSSAGQFASELQGRETQRQFGDTRAQYNDLATQVGQKQQEIEQNYNTGLLQLEQQKQQAVNQINRDFQNKLLDIANNRSLLGQAKAGARLEALQQLRQQVFAIQQQTIQFQQALEAQRQQAQLQVGNFNTATSDALTATGNALTGFNANTTTNPTSSFGPVGRSTQQGSQYIGQIRRPEDELYGQITPTRRNDLYSSLNA